MSTYFNNQPTAEQITKMTEGFQSWFEIELDAIGVNIDQVKTRTGGEIVPVSHVDDTGRPVDSVVADIVLSIVIAIVTCSSE